MHLAEELLLRLQKEEGSAFHCPMPLPLWPRGYGGFPGVSERIHQYLHLAEPLSPSIVHLCTIHP